jgi:hypothetical protein
MCKKNPSPKGRSGYHVFAGLGFMLLKGGIAKASLTFLNGAQNGAKLFYFGNSYPGLKPGAIHL